MTLRTRTLGHFLALGALGAAVVLAVWKATRHAETTGSSSVDLLGVSVGIGMMVGGALILGARTAKAALTSRHASGAAPAAIPSDLAKADADPAAMNRDRPPAAPPPEAWNDFTVQDKAEQELLQSEMAVARRIQSSMLPQKLKAEGLNVAALSISADQVGGDYYDVLPTADGAWIAIGDVAGHGLPAGIIMLTVQSAVSALTKQNKNASPKDILGTLNEVIYENIHERLKVNDYVTLTLMRFWTDGRIVLAGAHEETIVFRAATSTCESWPTHGTWIGLIDDIREATTESTHRLQHGDLMVVFTDGITEATNATSVPFGFERLVEHVTQVGHQPVTQVVDHVIKAVTDWAPQRHDDLSIMVLRYLAPGRPRSASMAPSIRFPDS